MPPESSFEKSPEKPDDEPSPLDAALDAYSEAVKAAAAAPDNATLQASRDEKLAALAAVSGEREREQAFAPKVEQALDAVLARDAAKRQEWNAEVVEPNAQERAAASKGGKNANINKATAHLRGYAEKVDRAQERARRHTLVENLNLEEVIANLALTINDFVKGTSLEKAFGQRLHGILRTVRHEEAQALEVPVGTIGFHFHAQGGSKDRSLQELRAALAIQQQCVEKLAALYHEAQSLHG